MIAVSSGPKPLEVPAGVDEALVATVPTWRRDIEIEADLAEEVARIHGYELIPGILPHTPMPPYRHPPLEVRDAIREVLAGAGLTEVVTHALVSPQIAETFRWESVMPPIDGGSPEGGRIVTVTNPLSVDHSVLRPALVGSIVQAVSTNVRHGTDDVTIFEIGKGYGFDGAVADATATVREWWRLALAGTGAAEPPSWDRPARPYDLGDAKGAIELIARRLRIGSVEYQTHRGEPLLHPGRAAAVRGFRDGHLALAGWVGRAASIDRRRMGPRGPRASSSPNSTFPASAAGGCRRSWPQRLPVIRLRNATSRSSSAKIARPARSGHDPRVWWRPAPVDEPLRRLPRCPARTAREEPGLPLDLSSARSDPRRGRSRCRDRGDHARDRIGSRRSGQDLSPVAVADSTLLRCGPPCSRPRGSAGHR